MTLFDTISLVIVVVALSGYLNSRIVRLPDSIGLTAIALQISLAVVAASLANPSIAQWGRRTAAHIDFSNLVLNGPLGLLLFAGSLHVDLSSLGRARWRMVVLATLGVVSSAALVGIMFFFGARVDGVRPPAIDCLLFGTLISPTDPVASLGLLSEAGVPQWLLTKISRESIFSVAAGVVLFLILSRIAVATQSPEVSGLAIPLLRQLFGGLGFGLIVGLLGSWLLRGIDSSAVEILITLAMATSGYAAAQALGVSAPIAAVVMGLVVANQGRGYRTFERTHTLLFFFWELTDGLLKLLLFALIGFEITALAMPPWKFLVVGLLAIPIVLVARFASVGIPSGVLRRSAPFEANSVKLMTWAGLRGATSVALALSLPVGHSRALIVTATYIVAIFSILVQAATVGPLARRWVDSAR